MAWLRWLLSSCLSRDGRSGVCGVDPVGSGSGVYGFRRFPLAVGDVAADYGHRRPDADPVEAACRCWADIDLAGCIEGAILGRHHHLYFARLALVQMLAQFQFDGQVVRQNASERVTTVDYGMPQLCCGPDDHMQMQELQMGGRLRNFLPQWKNCESFSQQQDGRDSFCSTAIKLVLVLRAMMESKTTGLVGLCLQADDVQFRNLRQASSTLQQVRLSVHNRFFIDPCYFCCSPEGRWSYEKNILAINSHTLCLMTSAHIVVPKEQNLFAKNVNDKMQFLKGTVNEIFKSDVDSIAGAAFAWISETLEFHSVILFNCLKNYPSTLESSMQGGDITLKRLKTCCFICSLLQASEHVANVFLPFGLIHQKWVTA